MQSKDKPESNPDTTQANETISPQMVTADSVQSGKVPVVRAGSQQAVSELQPKITTYSVVPTSTVSQPVPLVEQPLESDHSWREWLAIWWEGIRPAYLGLSLLPVALGGVVAWTQSISAKTPRGTFHVFTFVLTVIAVLLLQTSAHLINDYYDYLRGIDTNNSLGPGGLIQQGIIKPARVLAVGLIALALGATTWDFGSDIRWLARDCIRLDWGTRRVFLQWDTQRTFIAGTGRICMFFHFWPVDNNWNLYSANRPSGSRSLYL